MSECLISVIIPIYNTEQFLKACLDSLRAQTFHDFEAIMVDDGSTDGSGEICREYICLDSRFRMIHQENAGVSVARNRALEESKGSYIFFLDSDDVLPDDAFEKMIYADADLVMGSIIEVDDLGSGNGISQILPDLTATRQQALVALFDESMWGYQGYIWNKLYKRSIIENQHIRFDSNIKYNEDRLFLVRYLIFCTKIRLVSSVVYFYRQQEKSALAQMKKEFKPAVLTELDAFEKMKILVKDDNLELYLTISRLAFEKALYWFRRIPRKYMRERKEVRELVYKNAKICMSVHGKELMYKIKIVLHCVLMK